VGHATEHTFSGLSLQEGQTYYVTVKIQDTSGYLHDYGTSTCSSSGFVFNMPRDLTDVASSTYFNNARARVMCDISAGSVSSIPFANDELRDYRVPVTLTERGIESRLNAPVEITIADASVPGNINQATRQFRVSDEWGNEVPCNVTAAGGGQVTLVLIANLPKGGSKTYWVFWGGGSANPADFISSSNDTSQRAWSQYYSRKLLPPGIETDPISSWTKLTVTVGDWYDTGGTWVTLPWAFPYFAGNRTDWFLSIKGTLTGEVYRDYSNTWNEFIENNNNREMISPLWLDIAIRDTDPQPQDIGFYTIHKNAGQANERQGFFWRGNRYGLTDDIYMFQTFLYRYGDIAHRYEYITYAGLWVNGTWDNPVNPDPHHTVGISYNNNNDYFWSTPLREGIGQSPTSFFQYKDAVNYSVGTVENTGFGGFAGHFDSHVFDSRAAAPNWQTMEYEVTANGGSFNFLIRSGPTPEPDGSWTGWNQIVTGANANGSVAVPAANNQRFMQYRCVFLKSNVGDDPVLNRVNFICRGIEITQITATTPDGVSQGQDGIPVTVNVKNFHSSAVDLTDLELTFDLGSYTQSLTSHTLPTSIPAGGDIDFTFSVDVWPDSPIGTATIHANATGTAGALTFSDTDADTPHTWEVREKAKLYIKQIDATPTTVNKGQTVLVRMLIENQGDSPLVYDAATLTFSLGSYNQTVTSPAPGAIINGGDSMTATLSVEILPSSPSGVAILDGEASGHDSLSNKVASDTNAEITDSWIIQNPAVLTLQEITAPSIVYRGQVNVPVKLKVTNDGEAEATWDQSFLLPYFTLGTYDSVDEVSTFPISILGGLEVEGDYYVDVAPDTATGTSDVDAKIEGTDLNTGFLVDDEYAVLPASWTIIQEFVKTYSDAALLFESDSFNRPQGADTITVYCKGQSLAPFQEYTIRWYNPSGTQVSFTNPPLTSDSNGVLSDELILDSSADYGIWSVKITNPLNTHVACENQFSIVTFASLTVDLKLPDQVSIGQLFNASMTFINTGGADIDSGYPGTLVKNGPGDSTITAGPNPAFLDIPGYGQATFSYDLEAITAGNFSLTGTGYGYDANSNEFLTAATVTSNICLVEEQADPIISDLSAEPIFVNRNQQGIEVFLSIFNQPAAGATPPPYYVYDTGTENVSFVAGYSEGTGNSEQSKEADHLYLRAEGRVQNVWIWNFYYVAERTWVTDTTVDLTDVNNVHIRWRNVGDNDDENQSFFIVSPNKNADCTNSTLSIAKTRNFGWIEESIGVGGLSGNYYLRVHARDNNDYDAAIDSRIEIEQIWLEYAPLPSGNQADAIVEAASLTFDFGTHTQVVDSPSLPVSIAPGDTEIVTFKVGIAPDSDTGMVNISGSAFAQDENWHDKTFSITGGSHFWTIRGAMGICSANSSYNPEQYAFNIGQTVYARFQDLPLNQDYRIRFYNDSPTGGILVKTSPPLNSGDYGICDDLWTLDPADPNTITRQWRVIIDDGNAGTVGNILATQYFDVQNPATLVASLTLEPSSVFVGDAVTAYLSVTNPDADSATVELASATALVSTPSSLGDLTLDIDVVPASATISAEETATFTWEYTAADDTGLVGSYSMTADLNYSAAGYDRNSFSVVESNEAVSNSIFIYRRAIEIASGSLVHAAVEPGNTSDNLIFEVNNIGNYSLESVKWAIADLKNAGNDYISKSKLTFNPAVVGSIATSGSTIAKNFIDIPYNQASGTYIATMSVYEDLNSNDNRDYFEPFDLFSVEVEVLSAKNILLVNDYFDLGNWAPGQTTVVEQLEFFNAGNLQLDKVMVEQKTGSATFIVVDQLNFGSMTVGEYEQTDLYADIPVAATPGTYIATWTVFEDEDGSNDYTAGEPSDDFVVRVGVGDKSFTISPASINGGNATPTYTLENLPFDVNNTGFLSLNKLVGLPASLDNGSGDLIASDNIVIFPPTEVLVSDTSSGTVNLYIPAGTPAGLYTATQWVIEDDNLNGAWDAGEASASFDLSVNIVAYPAIQVIPSTVDLGDLAEGTGGTVLFWCRNTGNVALNDLRWEKVDLISSTDSIPASEYTFPPAEPFSASPGDIFQREVSINIPMGTDPGDYTGNVGWLYNDTDVPLVAKQLSEPQDDFQLALRVGNHSLDIIEAVVSTSGPPSEESSAGVFTLENTGTLTVSNPRASATALIGPDTIPADASTFTPFPIGYLVAGQSRSVSWRVQVPANTTAGTYNGTVTVWNDSNDNGLLEAGEASTNAPLELVVDAKRVIEVLPTVLDLGWATENSVTEGTIEIINQGNVALTDLTGLSATLNNAAMDSISNISFTPDPMGGLAIGASTLATVTVTVGSPQSTGAYSGIQRIYDDYNAPSGSYTVDEESDTFELRISIGRKQVDVTSPVNFPATNPGATVNSPNFTASNLSVIPLSRLKWSVNDLTDGGTNTIPAASLTFTPPVAPATYFGLGSSASNNSCQGSIDIGAYLPSGTYTGQHTLWEDEDNNGIIDPGEASATFVTNIVVNPVYSIDVLPATVDIGTVDAGDSSAMIDVDIMNTGNEILNTLAWTFQDLNDGGGNLIDSSYLKDQNTPVSLDPGQTATVQLYLDSVDPGQASGTYQAAGHMLSANGGATDNFAITVDIVASGLDIFGEGSLFQEIDPTIFNDIGVDPATDTERIIFSAMVNPGSGTAGIGFYTTDASDSLVRIAKLSVASDAQLIVSDTPGGLIVDHGYTMKIFHPDHPDFVADPGLPNWYRIYITFDFAFDSTTEDSVYIVLKNDSPAGHSVWFDGIQLEKGIYKDQTKPLKYGQKHLIVSPSKEFDMQGNRRFYNW
jgi:hypothetical protein